MAERMNRTIVEKAKCLLFDADLPKTFWAEACHMAAYLINRTITSVHDQVPEEMFYKRKINLTHLKIFGSDVMVHVPKEKRKKWDQKSVKLTFVGYDENSKGFRCINRSTKQIRVLVSRDVIFYEKQNSNILVVDHEDEAIAEVEGINAGSDDEATNTEATDQLEETLDETNDDGADNLDDADYIPNVPVAVDTSGIRTRSRKLVSHEFQLSNVALFADPLSVEEAMSLPESSEWRKAMDEEMESHKENNTLALTELPEDRKAIKAKWVFKAKRNQENKVVRYKARLVAK